jgi:formate-dependent nitrite reductase membrane component NrfD
VFYVCGSILAGWALLVSFIGITREDFPRSATTSRLVAAVSILLVAAAIFSGIYSGIIEEDEEHEDEPAASLVLPF